MSQLQQYVLDPSHVIELDSVQVRDNLTYDVIPLKISFGFLSAIINLIMNYTTATNMSIKWNNEILQPFPPHRDLRQGNLMSPYPFVLCMEKLSLSKNKFRWVCGNQLCLLGKV